MKITVHHAVTGADYRERGRAGWDVTASTAPIRLGLELGFTDVGAGKGVKVLPGRLVMSFDRRKVVEKVFWAEAKGWPDDAPDRKALRGDTRSGYTRAHVVLWPSREAADRLRDQVPFIDPIELDPRLRTAPDVVYLEDNPCPHCGGTGTAKSQADVVYDTLKALADTPTDPS